MVGVEKLPSATVLIPHTPKLLIMLFKAIKINMRAGDEIVNSVYKSTIYCKRPLIGM